MLTPVSGYLICLMKKKELTSTQQKRLGIAALIIAIAVMGLLVWLVGVPLVRFASQPEHFRTWVNSHGFGGRLAYMGMVILQVVVALIPGEPFEIAAGYAFGAVEGTLLCLAASALGSVCVFLLVRRFGHRLAEVFFSKEKLRSIRFLQTTRRRDLLFLIIFMLPGTPKDLLCYFAGLTTIRFPVWLLICSLGRLPSIVTSTIGGDALGTKNYWGAVLVFLVTLAISAAGLLFYDRLCARKQREKEAAAPSDAPESTGEEPPLT
jgi:uncharacterized membrane protein YdjX (TVP38/TMEM64 family)